MIEERKIIANKERLKIILVASRNSGKDWLMNNFLGKTMNDYSVKKNDFITKTITFCDMEYELEISNICGDFPFFYSTLILMNPEDHKKSVFMLVVDVVTFHFV